MRHCAIIIATDTRRDSTGSLPLLYRPIDGIPLLTYTLRKFEDCAPVSEVILIVDEPYLLFATESVVDRYSLRKVRRVKTGGADRFDSVLEGIQALPPDCECALVHDGTRPLISIRKIMEAIQACREHGAVVLTLPLSEGVKRVEHEFVLATLDRGRIHMVQTPQVFRSELLAAAYRNAIADGVKYDDDAAVVEHYGHKVRAIAGERSNLRVSGEEDFLIARQLLSGSFFRSAENV